MLHTVTHAELADDTSVVAMHGPFVLMPTSVAMTAEPTFEQWEAATQWAQKVEQSSPFWIGDLLAYGEGRYGETYAQALDATDYKYGSLANIAYVCNAVEPERRHEHLSFGHHQEVAPLPPADQAVWLDKAEAEQLTREQLRVQLKAHKAEATGATVELWLLVKCKDVDDQTDLADRMKLEGRAVQLKAKEL